MLDVNAKRYLCLVEAGYFSTLSPTSQASLLLQGGIMTSFQKENFEKYIFYKEAVALRRWDDLAKVPDLKTEPIEFYKKRVANSLQIN